MAAQHEENLADVTTKLSSASQIMTMVSEISETGQFFHRLVSLLTAQFNLDNARFYLPAPEAELCLILAAEAQDVPHSETRLSWRETELPVVQAFREQQSYYVPNLTPLHQLRPDLYPRQAASVFCVPLLSDGETLGILELIAEQFDPLMQQVQQILALQIAIILRRKQLDQEKNAMLHELTVRLNVTTSLVDVVEALATLDIHQGVRGAGLYTLETDADGCPKWATLRAVWIANGKKSPTPLGTRFHLPDFSTANLWIETRTSPCLISDTQDETQVADEPTRQLFRQIGAGAMIYFPLYVNRRWVGMMNIDWKTPQQFSERDQQLYRAITAQLAAVVDNRLLFEQMQDRAKHLELLSQIETNLSKTIRGREVLSALAQAFMGAEQAIPLLSLRMTLHYIEVNQINQPIFSEIVSIWQHGEIQLDDPMLNKRFKLEEYALTNLWMQSPNEVIYVADVQSDLRIDATSRQDWQSLGVFSTAIMPLYSGNRWQGLLYYSWTEPHHFIAEEQFLLNRLVEPVSAVVAARRAYLETQEANEKIEQRAKREQTLRDIIDKIREANNLPELIKITTEALGKQFSADYALLELGIEPTDEKNSSST